MNVIYNYMINTANRIDCIKKKKKKKTVL
jgi:hypothetical protein